MPLLYLVPMFSISLLYDDFLVSIKDFNDKKITKKMLFREYRKFQAITPSVVGIYFKICFGWHGGGDSDYFSAGTSCRFGALGSAAVCR